MPLIIFHQRVIICLLFLISLVPHTVVPAASAQGSGSPVLSIARAVALPSTLLTVQGDGFSAGGLVYLAIYDRWGVDVHKHVWTVASTTHFGANGSTDPAQGYVAAGVINELFDLAPGTIYGANGSQDPARGYTAGFDTASAAEALYGANGSQDPAQGYVAGADQVTLGASCSRDLMVRAYDHQAATWSNLLDVTAGC